MGPSFRWGGGYEFGVRAGLAALLTKVRIHGGSGIRHPIVTHAQKVPIVSQIPPARIVFLNQGNLPFAAPRLHLPLTCQRGVPCPECVVPDKAPAAVFARKAPNNAISMFVRTAFDIVGMADIERAVPLIGDDVNVESHLSVLPLRSSNVPVTPSSQACLVSKAG